MGATRLLARSLARQLPCCCRRLDGVDHGRAVMVDGAQPGCFVLSQFRMRKRAVKITA